MTCTCVWSFGLFKISHILPPANEVPREVIFSQVYVCPQGILPSLQSLVCGTRSFPGVPPGLWSQVLSWRGIPSQACNWGVPPGQDWGPPNWIMASPEQDRVLPDWVGVSLPVQTGYAMGGMPLAVPRKRTFLLWYSLKNSTCKHNFQRLEYIMPNQADFLLFGYDIFFTTEILSITIIFKFPGRVQMYKKVTTAQKS